tara:strand:+ start:4462 stop:5085 length:624 start_codon:yes stop_codon:yes gene_type:complete
MALSRKDSAALISMMEAKKFREKQRISYKMVNKNKIHFEGKGHYYYIHACKEDETITDVIMDELQSDIGGYARVLFNLKKGSKFDFSIIDNCVNFNRKALNAGVKIDQFGGCALGLRRDSIINSGISLKKDGTLKTDAVIVEIGGTSNGFFNFKNPSSVKGDLIIRTIKDSIDLLLNKKKEKELMEEISVQGEGEGEGEVPQNTEQD